VTGGWRKLHNEELHNFYASLCIIRMMENEMGRACSTNGAKRNAYRLLVGKPEGKSPLQDQEVGGWAILNWISERQNGMAWIGLMWLRIGASGGLL
jgi:hypothetical protein